MWEGREVGKGGREGGWREGGREGGKEEGREEGGKEGEILTQTFSNMISYSWFVASLPIFTKM